MSLSTSCTARRTGIVLFARTRLTLPFIKIQSTLITSYRSRSAARKMPPAMPRTGHVAFFALSSSRYCLIISESNARQCRNGRVSCRNTPRPRSCRHRVHLSQRGPIARGETVARSVSTFAVEDVNATKFEWRRRNHAHVESLWTRPDATAPTFVAACCPFHGRTRSPWPGFDSPTLRVSTDNRRHGAGDRRRQRKIERGRKRIVCGCGEEDGNHRHCAAEDRKREVVADGEARAADMLREGLDHEGRARTEKTGKEEREAALPGHDRRNAGIG